MQAVVLAAGAGTRLRPFTHTVPKPMIPVQGRPFLEHVLELLKQGGIDNVVLSIGHLGNQIRAYFRDGSGFGIMLRYSAQEGTLLGAGGALKQAEGLLDRWFFVVNGDTYLPVNYRDVAAAFAARKKRALMVVYDNREDTRVRNNVALDAHSMVTRYDKNGLDPDLRYVDAGVSVLRRDVLRLLEPGRSASLERDVYPHLAAQREFAAYRVRQRFYDIGTWSGLKDFESFVGDRRSP